MAAARLVLFDTTLRDGLARRQVARAAVLELARQLDAAGLDVVELGAVATGREEAAPMREACAQVTRARACVLAYPRPAAITLAGDVLAGAARPRLHVFNQTSGRPSLASGEGDFEPDERLAEITRTVAAACACCDDVEWSALDATHAEPGFLAHAVEAAVEAGATTISLPDTRGRATPAEVAGMVGAVADRLGPERTATLSVHCHDDLGNATASVLAALASGARQVECTVGGIGPQGGNTNLGAVVRALGPDFRTGVGPQALVALEARVAALFDVT